MLEQNTHYIDASSARLSECNLQKQREGLSGRRIQLFPAVSEVLSPSGAGDDYAIVLADGLKPIPVIFEHEGKVGGKASAGFGEDPGAIVVHGIGARPSRRTDAAVCARFESKGDIASAIEVLNTHLGVRTDERRRRVSNNEAGRCVSEVVAAQGGLRAVSLCLGCGS